jgi:hypothetical protein
MKAIARSFELTIGFLPGDKRNRFRLGVIEPEHERSAMMSTPIQRPGRILTQSCRDLSFFTKSVLSDIANFAKWIKAAKVNRVTDGLSEFRARQDREVFGDKQLPDLGTNGGTAAGARNGQAIPSWAH